MLILGFGGLLAFSMGLLVRPILRFSVFLLSAIAGALVPIAVIALFVSVPCIGSTGGAFKMCLSKQPMPYVRDYMPAQDAQ